MTKFKRYFIRINNESIDNMISEYGTLGNDGFATISEAKKDFKSVSEDYCETDFYEVIEISVKSVSGKLDAKVQ